MIKIAFFDIDHTITKHSTSLKYFPLLLKRKRPPIRVICNVPRLLYKYNFGNGATADSYSELVKDVIGWEESLLDKISQECFDKKIKKDIFPEIKELIEKYKREGVKVLLATSSPRFVVRPLFEWLKADWLIATELEYINGKTTGRFVGLPNYKKEKWRRVSAFLDGAGYSSEQCAFYSDSIHDLPSLEAVGMPVAVNPDRRLKKEAKKRGWKIIQPKL